MVTTKLAPSTTSSSSPAKEINRTDAVAQGWQCSTFTYHNKKLSSLNCKMCQSSRSLAALSPTAPTAITRHTGESSATLHQSKEEQARSKWERIVDFCRKSGVKFVDGSFPPAGKSLHNCNDDDVQCLRTSQIVRSTASHVK